MGLSLPLRQWGRGPEPLLFVHGFTGTGAAFDHLEPLLGEHVRVAAVDLPGHGRCALPAEGASGWNETVEAIAIGIEHAYGGPAHLVGYSLGARLALATALRFPGLVRSLVLESGSPGLRGDEQRSARRAEDAELAASIERDGVAAFIERWETNDVLTSLRKLPPALGAALRERRLGQDAAGLAWTLRHLGAGVQPDLWPKLRQLEPRTLLLHGSRDDKFRAHAERMALRMREAQLHEVRRAGHAPHLEAPERYAAALLEHLRPPRREERPAETAAAAPPRETTQSIPGSQP